MDNRPDINPQTKIGAMLDAYPHLEEVLLRLSPSFAKLKNPVLRKTVGRVASLRQAAEIGGIDLGEMISILRKSAGIDNLFENAEPTEKEQPFRPEWANPENVFMEFDASETIESGGSPMKIILEKAEQLSAGKVMLLIVPFKPVPIIELLNSKGYQCWSENRQNKVYTYIKK